MKDILVAENTLDTDTLSTSGLYKTINRDKADINSRLVNASIFPRLQENSRI
ncbi:hypothetical protein HGO53_03080 [Wolbachia endosymbiont of Diaphorina citri]|jgi:hypothetical protein|uniref:hypothetical protein n=1 Tax=Wolbachia endosymbiont of Diaphorina citri TaxID=116598 RepID=UPI0002F5C322|nr:hypothetical protein [Wolbachia endosymbiont of Diaphorina citri]QJT94295.1 hypothetical protein HGO48_02370 [Wolbachia endosymbiont of Diaphorina citri]QJT95536.1 hypothetical protein HGO49_02370 [Wolbachia endosymbiont of Diaphorina citri]QJT96897.1 hypothetical protein HGO53_03080 [Wolbachia endosymbiont of Diaphorina citri]QLK11193.1 hypothetical protein FK497_02415 [Wolbachia endosymbiont of Diaphorina citri]QXY87276.1 hypothetical protein GZ064_05360 [Wolbachia endosymbiont of Diaphor